MKKLFLSIIMFTVFIINVTWVNAQPLSIDAKSYILIDSKTGQVICEYNADEKTYPASTTKIMTAIIGLENWDPEQIMTVSQYAIDNIGPGGMHVGLLNGEQLKFKDLLGALLVRSANETGYVVAENIGPTPEDFFALMNKRAKELGATNTNFVNPCGMDNGKDGENHLSTARDLALIAKHAMTLPLFRETVRKTVCTIPPTNKHPEAVTVPTTNKLFNGKYKSEYYSGITGIKTGYTDRAAYNLVSSAVNEDGMELIAVILGCKSYDGIFQYSKELLEYGFKNYSMQRIVSSNSFIKSIPIENAGYNPNLNLVAAENLECALPKDINIQDSVIEDIHIDNNITAPVKKDDILGFIEYKKDGISLGKVNIIASRDVEKLISSPASPTGFFSSFKNKTSEKVILSVIALLMGFMALRIILRKISRSRRLNRY